MTAQITGAWLAYMSMALLVLYCYKGREAGQWDALSGAIWQMQPCKVCFVAAAGHDVHLLAC